MADPLPLAELEFQILLLPPISRGAHLGGPTLHARRLVELWKVDDDNGVPLAQAFRLLDTEAVAGAILRTVVAGEGYPGDPRYWTFPGLEDLLPELRDLAWQSMLAGALLIEGIKGVRGTRHRAKLPAELARLTPDWELSRLTRGASDEFIDVRVRRPPAEPVKKAWRQRPSPAAIKAAALVVARTYQPDDAPPTAATWKAELEARLGGPVTRAVAHKAQVEWAPHLLRQRGQKLNRRN